MLIRRAEVEGRLRDVRVAHGRIAALADELAAAQGEELLDAGGGALLPGLHDHHIHLLALAAARRSVRCGPPQVENAPALGAALARARSALPPQRWIRGVGYHESVAGPLDRRALDAWVDDRPVRVQHRSGALWVLNSAGVERARLDAADHPGVERDERGAPTGRVFRADAWLRERLGAGEVPSLAEVGAELAARGVTGVTDATPSNGADELALFARASDEGALPQRLWVMGDTKLPEPRHPKLRRAAVKLLLDEANPIGFEALCDVIAGAHGQQRPIAIHCVTRSELVLAASALNTVGARDGDRIEHASVAPPEALALLASLPVTVVTQPNFVAERGDAYRRDVDPADHPYLYRCQGFLDANVALGGGPDAPFGEPDPWAAMRAAVDRRTAGGAPLGPDEALSPERALALFTSPPGAPGAAPRRVVIGAPADLVLLDRPWKQARERLSSGDVALCLCGGRAIRPTDPSTDPPTNPVG
ncbi:MAG: amidohydrolase family protein [Myxococcota bacterium]